MCGIAGIVAKQPVDLRAVERMNMLQEHRGPSPIIYYRHIELWTSADGSWVPRNHL